MENHQHHSGHQMPTEKKMENQRDHMDHSKMDHSSMQHDDNPAMGMEGHDHHAMMINDFKRRFFITLILTIPIMLLSPMIQHWLGVDWNLPVPDIFYLSFQPSFMYMADGLF